jgi:hypothetical protein
VKVAQLLQQPKRFLAELGNVEDVRDPRLARER